MAASSKAVVTPIPRFTVANANQLRTPIVGQLLFRDWTVAKIMGTAVIVGSVGSTRSWASARPSSR